MRTTEYDKAFSTSFLESLGFTIVHTEVSLVNSVEGGLILCMDDRNKLHKKLPGAAVPGAFTGLRIVMPGLTPDERAKEVLARSAANGFVATTHGDLAKGALLGCAVRSALIDGMLDGFPKTTAAESQRYIAQNKIPHRILRGEHTAKKIVLNFNQGTTIEPNGEYFVVDFWLPLLLDARMDMFTSLVAQSAKLVLRNNRILYVV